MLTPEKAEEYLREEATVIILKREISEELAIELNESGILDILLKKRITTELEKTDEEEDKTENNYIEELAKEWFGCEIDRKYLERKESNEKVCFRLFRNRNKGVALEVHQRLVNKEQSWESISEQWGESPEKEYGGKYNPTYAKRLSRDLRGILKRLQPGEISQPEKMGKFYTITELVNWVEIELNDEMRKEIEMDMIDEWINKRTSELKKEIIGQES